MVVKERLITLGVIIWLRGYTWCLQGVLLCSVDILRTFFLCAVGSFWARIFVVHIGIMLVFVFVT